MDKATAIKFVLTSAAHTIHDDFNKRYYLLVDFCKEKEINPPVILRKAAKGELSLYVFCEISNNTDLIVHIDDLDLEPYVVPFENGELVNPEGEIKVKVCDGPDGIRVPLEQLKVAINFTEYESWPGFYKLRLFEAQALYCNQKIIITSERNFLNGEWLERPLPSIEVEVTLDNVCVFEDEINNLFPHTNISHSLQCKATQDSSVDSLFHNAKDSKDAISELEEPYYFLLASRCWEELFGRVETVYKKDKPLDFIIQRLKELLKDDNRTLEGQDLDDLGSIILPNELTSKGPIKFTDKYLGLKGKNEAAYKLWSPQLEAAGKLLEELGTNYTNDEASDLIDCHFPVGTDKRRRRRLKFILSKRL